MIENFLLNQVLISCKLPYTSQNTEGAVREKRQSGVGTISYIDVMFLLLLVPSLPNNAYL